MERDLNLYKKREVDIVFTPQVSASYPSDYSTYIQTEQINKRLAGTARSHFFRGFATSYC